MPGNNDKLINIRNQHLHNKPRQNVLETEKLLWDCKDFTYCSLKAYQEHITEGVTKKTPKQKQLSFNADMR